MTRTISFFGRDVTIGSIRNGKSRFELYMGRPPSDSLFDYLSSIAEDSIPMFERAVRNFLEDRRGDSIDSRRTSSKTTPRSASVVQTLESFRGQDKGSLSTPSCSGNTVRISSSGRGNSLLKQAGQQKQKVTEQKQTQGHVSTPCSSPAASPCASPAVSEVGSLLLDSIISPDARIYRFRDEEPGKVLEAVNISASGDLSVTASLKQHFFPLTGRPIKLSKSQLPRIYGGDVAVYDGSDWAIEPLNIVKELVAKVEFEMKGEPKTAPVPPVVLLYLTVRIRKFSEQIDNDKSHIPPKSFNSISANVIQVLTSLKSCKKRDGLQSPLQLLITLLCIVERACKPTSNDLGPLGNDSSCGQHEPPSVVKEEWIDSRRTTLGNNSIASSDGPDVKSKESRPSSNSVEFDVQSMISMPPDSPGGPPPQSKLVYTAMSTIGSGSESREASARQLEIGMEEKRRTKGLTWVVRDSLKLARLAVQDRRRWIRDRKRFETNRELDGPLAYSLRHTQFLENLEDLLGTVLRYLYDVNEALVAWSGNVLDKEDVVRQEVVRLVSSLEGCQFEKDLKKPLEDLEKFFDRMQSMTNEIQ